MKKKNKTQYTIDTVLSQGRSLVCKIFIIILHNKKKIEIQ